MGSISNDWLWCDFLQAVPDHDRLKDSLVSDKDWKRDDISTWIKRWGTLTAEAQKADAATLAAAAAAAAAAKDIAAAEAAANATNETQKFVILQNVAFRKVIRLSSLPFHSGNCNLARFSL